MSKIRLVSPYRPRPVQKWLDDQSQRFDVLVIHRRAGKTVYAINRIIKAVLACQLPAAKGHYFCPFQKQAKRNAWQYVQEFTAHIPGMSYNKSELTAYFPAGQTIELLGADNPDAFRGGYSDYVVLDEYAQMDPRTWGEIVRPALADRSGAALFIGTPAGPNAFKELYDRAQTMPGWFTCLLKYQDTGLISDSEIESMRREMEESQFAQEMECDFSAAIKGAYFGKVLTAREQAGAIGRVPYDDTLGVWTSWDLGIRDSTCIWFLQTLGSEVRIIDYMEVQGEGLPELAKRVAQKPYRYDGHIAPHDIRVRELGTGTSRYEVASKLGINFQVCRNMPLMDGIDATRNLLKRAFIDSEKCEQGYRCLQLYRSEWNDAKRIFSDRPIHDWTSHAADALRMFAVEMSQGTTDQWGSGINYDMLDKMAV